MKLPREGGDGYFHWEGAILFEMIFFRRRISFRTTQTSNHVRNQQPAATNDPANTIAFVHRGKYCRLASLGQTKSAAADVFSLGCALHYDRTLMGLGGTGSGR